MRNCDQSLTIADKCAQPLTIDAITRKLNGVSRYPSDSPANAAARLHGGH